jgi:hypothetical protein
MAAIIFLSFVFALFIVAEAVPLLVIIVGVFFCFIYPIVGIYIWLLGELILGDYQVVGANIRTYITFFLGSYLLIKESVIHKFDYLRRFRTLLIIPLFILAWGVSISILTEEPPTYYLRWVITFLSNVFLVIYMGLVIKNVRDLKKAISFFFLLLALSSIIGVMQYFNISAAFKIRYILTKVFVHSPQGRIIGLSRSVIEMAYSLVLGVSLLFGALLGDRRQLIKRNKFIVVLFALIFLATFLNATRSAIGGLFFSACLMFLFFRNKLRNIHRAMPRRLIIASAGGLSIIVITLFLLNLTDNKFILNADQITLRDTSASGRLPRLELAYNVFLKYPFGVGGWFNYERVTPSYWSDLSSSAGMSMDNFSVHNHFLRAFLFYGFPGGLLLLLYFAYCFSICYRGAPNSKYDYLNSVFISGIFYFPAYSFNIFFHNAGPLSGDNLFWFMIGLIAVALTLRDAGQ